MSDKVYQLLDWDTAFFGYKVARILDPYMTDERLRIILDELRAQAVKVVYWNSASTNAISSDIIVQYDGLLADEKTTYVGNLQNTPEMIGRPARIVSYLHHAPNQQLTSLAFQSGEFSRFKNDKHFTHREFERLYTEWLNKSLTGQIADEVLVCVTDEVEAGMLTLRIKNERADIGIFAVDQHFRGKKIGTSLFRSAIAKAQEWNCSHIQVVTQKKNQVACRFYEHIGLIVESVQNVYHFWL